MADEGLDRINQNWPPGLKEEIKAKMGNARGVVTDFTVEAVRVRLRDASAIQEQEAQLKARDKEISELRYMVQQLADRYVIGGDHEDRQTFLMELQLPAWLSVEGWPADLAAQKPIRDPKPQPVGVPAGVSTTIEPHLGPPKPQPPTEAEVASFVATAERITGVPDMPVPPGTAANEVKLAEEVMAAPPMEPDVEVTKDVVSFAHGDEPASDYDDPDLHRPMFMAPGSDDFLARVQAKGAEKGIDVSGLGLRPASTLPAPDKEVDPNPHNHAWETVDGIMCCSCGAWVDMTDPAYPQGVVRGDPEAEGFDAESGLYVDDDDQAAEAELPTQPAPVLDVPAPPPTPVAPRELAQYEVDF